MKHYPHLITAIVSIGIVAIGAAFGVRYFLDYTAQQKNDLRAALDTINAQITLQDQKLTTTTHQVDLLVTENTTVKNQLASETKKRLALEEQRATEVASTTKQINSLAADLKATKTPTLADVIATWRPRIAQVHCKFMSGGVMISEQFGSGVLVAPDTRAAVITNRHVVASDGKLADTCEISFPYDTAVTVVPQSSFISSSQEGVDWARLDIASSTPYMQKATAAKLRRCQESPALGDAVAILGFPAIGSQTDVTATGGVVSGFDASYIITDAKIERGNSGGGAILVKQNCILGMPTFVETGGLESLARILDQRLIPFQ